MHCDATLTLQVLADVATGRIKLLFVSPERLGNPHLLEALRQRMPLPLVVVDEAHCVAGKPVAGAATFSAAAAAAERLSGCRQPPDVPLAARGQQPLWARDHCCCLRPAMPGFPLTT